MSHQGSYHHGDLKNALIDAGIHQLDERGLEGLSLRTVAKRAGVSHTAPYRHFKDKSQLLAAIAISGYEQLARKMQQLLERYPHDPEEAVIKMGVAFLEVATLKPKKAQLMFCPSPWLNADVNSAHITNPNVWSQELKAACEKPKALLIEGLSELRPEKFLEHAVRSWAALHGMAALIALGIVKPEPTNEYMRNLSQDLLGLN